MPRRIYDEEYVNEKELKKGHTYISLKVLYEPFRNG